MIQRWVLKQFSVWKQISLSSFPRYYNRLNTYIFLVMTFIILLGLVNVLTSTGYIGLVRLSRPFYFFQKQVVWFFIGLSCQICLMLLPLSFLRRSMNFVFLLLFFILTLIFFPGFYYESGGATRWFHVGGISFQPSEFIKVFLLFFLSYSVFAFEKIRYFLPSSFLKSMYDFFCFFFFSSPDYMKKKFKMNTHFYQTQLGQNWFYLAGWIFLWGGGTAVLVFLQKDLGGGIVLFSLLFYFLVVRIPFGLTLTMIFGFVMFLFYAIAYFPFRMRRLLIFLNPAKDPGGDGYQLIQSMNGFLSGGVWGQGFENSFQQYLYLPAAHTDFAFSIWAEQFGLFGCLFVVSLYLILITLIYQVGYQSKNSFFKEMSFATMWMFSVQVIVNLGVVTGLLPTKGLVLPLFNFGGSSLLTNMILLGWIMRVDKENRNYQFKLT